MWHDGANPTCCCGLAICEKAIFRTKAYNETVESVQEWDCVKLRNNLSNNKQSSATLKSLFDKSTNFYQLNSKKPKNSYFKVELEGVSSFRNYIFDLKRVHDYLSTNAPVPFNTEVFSFGKSISKYLKKKLDNYSTYNIYLNGHKIYKPYKDQIKVTKKGYDTITDINFFNINMDDELLAFGWYGFREELLGSISKGEKLSGIRVRLGNILIGDDHLLDECFRELRFNGYLIGEIHVNNPHLIPNSRRDDFIDNEHKTFFYNEVARKIGLPLSKEIRNRSRIHSLMKNSEIKPIAKADFKIKPASEYISITELRKYLDNECYDCPKLNLALQSLKQKN